MPTCAASKSCVTLQNILNDESLDGTTATPSYIQGECWRALKGRFSTMLRASLSIRASKEHGLVAHGECRHPTSAIDDHCAHRSPYGTTTTTPCVHGECWRELKGRFSTMLRAPLSIRTSKEHGQATHDECRRPTSARCSSSLVICVGQSSAGGIKFSPVFVVNGGKS